MSKKSHINNSTRIKDLVIKNYSTASIFNKYGIDYCFKKKLNLKMAAEEKKIDLEELENELRRILDSDNSKIENYNEWDLLTLSDHLVREQHAYIRETIPQINEFMQEINDGQGEVIPIMKKISILFQQLSEKIKVHINREDRMIFPLVKYLIDCKSFNERPRRHGYDTIKKTIDNMASDHQNIYKIIVEMRTITKNYTVTENKGVNYHTVMQKLRQFEQDLLKIFHLENNILFPKAFALEKELARL